MPEITVCVNLLVRTAKLAYFCPMIKFLARYKAFFIGFIIIIPIFYLLNYAGFIILPEEKSYEIVFYGVIWGLIIALPIHYYKRKKKTVIQVIGLTVLIIVTLLIDSAMKLPDNPITFALLMGFWLGIAYLLAPTFIRKYWKLITLIYIPLFLYFIYLREI